MADTKETRTAMPDAYALGLEEVDQTQIATVGGKGAQLGELAHIEGTHVPAGYCVTTAAFSRFLADAPWLDDLLERLSRLDPAERDDIRTLSEQVRDGIGRVPIAHDLAKAITHPLGRLGEHSAYAVRSSATAEDLPTASFAGQQDTFLNIVGPAAVLEHIRLCWASLFTERAVTYRLQNGIDQRAVRMAVVVQRMLTPQVSGVMFTADPVTSNRKVRTVEATFGLGEALVGGLVDADVYRVRDDRITDRTIATKKTAIHALPDGGTQEQAIASGEQKQPTLTDTQVLRLTELGRRIEAHYGRPQDIEWCLVDDRFHIVQSRPITTVFPIPETDDDGNHVYVSVGHQQMMTDAMKPLGLSFWQLTTPLPMAEAGGRLFADVTQRLASSASRTAILEGLGESDPLIRDALETVLARDDFIEALPEETPSSPLAHEMPVLADADPALVTDLVERTQASMAVVARDIQTKCGSELFDFIRADLAELQALLLDPQGLQLIMTAIGASQWLNEHLHTWLGEDNAADTLTLSAANNITSQMGLDLLDVADVLRPHQDVVAFLREVEDENFLAELPRLTGGDEAQEAITAYLDTYGMRCIGEIDITRPRWREQPTALVPSLLANVDTFEPGASKRLFEQGRRAARDKEVEVLERLRALPDGRAKAEQTQLMITRLQTYIGYREYPKYGMVSRYLLYKQALLDEADKLVQAGVLTDVEDVFYLRFEEFHATVRTGEVDHELIRRRREAFDGYRALTPPRVLTSDGESVPGAYRRDGLPDGALVGLPVSAGVVEGRARVVRDLADADLEPGDILVTAYTDPSWSPLFVTIKGLVTEVGGLMTHGAVVAREYGLTAVVGVQDATQLISDGQRIRVDGTSGYVEILTEGAGQA